MKKILFATTALVATAGVAAADVAITGTAEMGLFGGSATPTFAGETQFFTDIDVTFTLSGTTDNGLTFGAAVDLDEGGFGAAAVADNADDGGVAIFLSGNFGTVTLGDTDGALDWAMTEVAVGNAGSINDDETAHGGYLGSYGDGAYDGQILRYDNTFGDFGVAVSVEMDDTGARDAGFAIGVRYSIDLGGTDVNLGAGYQFVDANNYNPGNTDPFTFRDMDFRYNIFGLSASATLDSGLSVGIAYTDYQSLDADDEYTHIGIGAGYTFDAITVSANYGIWYIDPVGISDGEITGFGLAAAYDLGGGASVHLGYGSSESTVNVVSNTWSFGVAMSF